MDDAEIALITIEACRSLDYWYVEDLDLRTPRGIDRSVIAHLADGGWIARQI